MREKDLEIIKDNLTAFRNNFGDVRIEEYFGTYNVYYPADSPEGSYIQHCYDISYLDGWLYGCVQAVNRKEFKEVKL